MISIHHKISRIFAILFIAIITTTQGYGKVIDYDKIKEAVNNPHSSFYYPTLVAKYNSNDTTMNDEEYLHYYLGYTFQEDYNPYRNSEFSHKLDHLYKLDYKPSVAEYENMAMFAKQTLNDDPFDLRQMNILVYALKGLHKHNEAKIWQYRLEHIITAILSTGDGLTPETAWHVIYPAHEYIILNRLGMKAIDFVYVEPCYDYIEVEKNSLWIEGYYFNAERIIDIYNMKFNTL